MTRDEAEQLAARHMLGIEIMRYYNTLPAHTISAIRNLYAAELAQYPDLAAKVRAA